MELSGEGLNCSAIKESEDGEWIVLRCTNLHAQPVAGMWRLPGVQQAMLARLDETPVEGIPVQHGRVEIVAPGHGVVTILGR